MLTHLFHLLFGTIVGVILTYKNQKTNPKSLPLAPSKGRGTETDNSIIEDLGCSPCKHTLDGYCLRNENDYCKDGECNCPHWIAETRTLTAQCGCETTATFCTACGEQLTKPKTDC